MYNNQNKYNEQAGHFTMCPITINHRSPCTSKSLFRLVRKQKPSSAVFNYTHRKLSFDVHFVLNFINIQSEQICYETLCTLCIQWARKTIVKNSDKLKPNYHTPAKFSYTLLYTINMHVCTLCYATMYTGWQGRHCRHAGTTSNPVDVCAKWGICINEAIFLYLQWTTDKIDQRYNH